MAPPTEFLALHVGTRQSALALKQTELVIQALKKAHSSSGITFQIHAITTTGDKDQKTALYNFGGKGLWTTELEAMLNAGDVDLVVHSLKDMPTTLPDDCALGCITAREDPRDVVIFKPSLLAEHGWRTLADLPAGAVVGTSSVRRIAQLSRRYPNLRFADVRGNIETRLRKLDDEAGPFAAIILAAAGLLRMGYDARIAQYLDSAAGMLHAVGQGAMGIEVRAGDARTRSIVRAIEDRRAMLACTAERSLMRALGGGCSVPIGVETSWAAGVSDALRLKATVVKADGSEAVDVDSEAVVGDAESAEAFGEKVAQELVEKGANKILDTITQGQPVPANPAAA